MDFEKRLDEWDGDRFPYESTTNLSYHDLKVFIRKLIEMNYITSSGDNRIISILDVGSGKGKMLYVFSKIGGILSKRWKNISFTVVGIEYRRNLVRKAEENLEVLHKRIYGPIRIIHADAETYEELDCYNIIYLYNPFGKNILESFLKHLNESIKQIPRQVWIIYCNPVFEETILDNGYEYVTNFFYNTTVYKKR